MKGLKSKALALLLVLALAAMPMSAFAAGEGETTIGGSSGEEDYLVNVVLPMSLNYYINRLSFGSGINQVTNVDFPVINKSGVPVAVDVTVTTQDTNDDDDPDTVTLVTSLDDLQQERNQADSKDKKVLFGILGASDVGEDPIAFDTEFASSGDYFDYPLDAVDVTVDDIIDSSTFRMFTYGEDDPGAMIQIVLDAATGNDNPMATQSVIAEDDKGVSSFTFFAALNTFADWEEGDLDVKGVFDVTALNSSFYDKEAEDFVEGGLNILPAGEDDGGDDDNEVAQNGESAMVTQTLTGWVNGSSAVEFKFKTPPNTQPTSVERQDVAYTYTSAQYSYNTTTGVFQLKQLPSTAKEGIEVLVIFANNVTYTLNITTTPAE